MNKNLLEIYDLKIFPWRINWEISRECNFSCAYCVNDKSTTKVSSPVHTPEKIADIFDSTGKDWLLLITGGEPFVYPDFNQICLLLSQKHHLQITTNLSSPDIYKFADTINPAKIFLISASFHYTERKRRNLVDDFIDKCKYLNAKGFTVLVNYIAHPESLPLMEEFLTTFKLMGISSFALALRGEYNGKKYPESYTENELELVKKYILDETIELSSAMGELNYYGRYCTAGQSYFFMNPQGEVSRCATLQKPLGNLFEENMYFGNKLTPCIAKNCKDVYCGVAAVTNKKACKIKVFLEERKYKNQYK